MELATPLIADNPDLWVRPRKVRITSPDTTPCRCLNCHHPSWFQLTPNFRSPATSPRSASTPRPAFPLTASARSWSRLPSTGTRGGGQFCRLNAKYLSIAFVEFVVISITAVVFYYHTKGVYMLTLKLLPATYVIWQLPSNAPTPTIDASTLTVVIRTADELSGVCETSHAPAGAVINDGWRCLQFVGPFDLSLPGIMAQVATPLAQAGVPIFTLATYNTDYLLVPSARLADACNAIQQAGHVMSN